MLRGVAYQRINGLDLLAEVFLVGYAVSAFGIAAGLAILVVDIDEINVAGYIEFTCTKLAHADNTQLGSRALWRMWCAMLCVQCFAALVVSRIQGKFGQVGHDTGYGGQGGTFVAIQVDEPLNDQLAHSAQTTAHIVATGQQTVVQRLHAGPCGCARRE